MEWDFESPPVFARHAAAPAQPCHGFRSSSAMPMQQQAQLPALAWPGDRGRSDRPAHDPHLLEREHHVDLVDNATFHRRIGVRGNPPITSFRIVGVDAEATTRSSFPRTHSMPPHRASSASVEAREAGVRKSSVPAHGARSVAPRRHGAPSTWSNHLISTSIQTVIDTGVSKRPAQGAKAKAGRAPGETLQRSDGRFSQQPEGNARPGAPLFVALILARPPVLASSAVAIGDPRHSFAYAPIALTGPSRSSAA